MISNSNPEDSSKLVYTIPRGETDQVRLALREYKGRLYIDLRLWFQDENDSSFKPTKKGVSMSVEHLQALREGVRQLEQFCEKLKQNPPKNHAQPPQPRQMSSQKRQPNAWQRHGGN